MSSNGGGFKTFLSFVTGAAIGAIFGILYAPQSGTETRKKVRDIKDKLADDLKEEYSRMSGRAKTFADETKGKIQEARTKVNRKNESGQIES